ncbi:MAG: lipid-A-disaccharide synthase [Nitrospirae bacterium]|nr:MAG: lipid-A-disaccharide synthase [Nitrospirota bacterium]
MKKVFIITGEVSGETYGANLSKQLKGLFPDIHIYGIGGPRMKAEGVELFGTITGAFGLTETIGHLKTLRENMKKTEEMLQKERPDVVVLIDFPEFNMKVAQKAKQSGAKVLYYVAPQVWAWRRGRIKKIKALCDRLAVILPFEERLFREASVDAEFVGHPIMEEVQKVKGSKALLREHFGLRPDVKTVALLPGSRISELKRHLPLFIEVVEKLKKRYQSVQFILPLAPGLSRDAFSQEFDILNAMDVKILQGRATEAFIISDSALVASGTATLQGALTGCPMVVVYKLFPLTYIIGRIVVRGVRHISLVNILSGKEVVKELLQWHATGENVFREIVRTLEDDNLRAFMVEAFRKIRAFYEHKNPSLRVAQMVGELAGWRS